MTGARTSTSEGPDVDRELRELRTRAYGPHPDIEEDPVAFARLAELEFAHLRLHAPAQPDVIAPDVIAPDEIAPDAAAPSGAVDLAVDPAAPPPDPEPGAKGTRRRRISLAVCAVVAVAAVVAAAILVSDPPPDATLPPSGAEPDDQLIALLEAEGREWEQLDRSLVPGASQMEIDLSTLRAFGTYRDIELWSATNAFASPCLIAVHRATVDVVARACVPAGADLLVDTRWHGLTEGERLRFFHRGDTVDAYLLVSEEVD